MEKADFHLHLDGSLLLEIVEALLALKENEANKPEGWETLTTEEKEKFLSVPQDCKSLDDYLKCFSLSCKLLQTESAIKLATYMLVMKLAEQGIEYANLRFAPQQHSVGIPNNEKSEHEQRIVEAAMQGAEKAMRELREAGKIININFILCCMRNNNWGNNEEDRNGFALSNKRTVEIAKKMLDRVGMSRIIGVDLAGGEFGNPNSEYDNCLNVITDIPLIIHSRRGTELPKKN